MATSGTWRWQMSQALGDPTHDMFWQQLLRWVAGDSPGPVQATMPVQRLMDDGHVRLTAMVRDKEYMPAPDATCRGARDWAGWWVGAGGYEAGAERCRDRFRRSGRRRSRDRMSSEVTAARGPDELGRDVLTFERTDGVAENFHTEQNRELLEKLSSQTGGRYWKTDELERLPKEISYSEAGISVRDTKELWDMPIVFLLLLGLMAGGVAAAAQVGCDMRARGCCCYVAGCWLQPLRASVYYVTVAGLGGEPDYEQRFTANAKELDKVFKASSGAHVYTLTGNQATRARLTETMAAVAREAKPEDDFVLTLIGHGSFDGVEYKFNLVGPDVSAAELAAMCDKVAARRQLW